jgi:hypothetical protein
MQLIVGRHPNIRNDGSRMPIDVEMSSFFINRERYDSRAHPKLVLSRHYTQNPHSGSMSAIACSRSNDCRHFMESLHSNPSARHRYVRGTSCALERRAGMVDFSPPGFNDQLLFSATVEIQSICSLSVESRSNWSLSSLSRRASCARLRSVTSSRCYSQNSL